MVTQVSKFLLVLEFCGCFDVRSRSLPPFLYSLGLVLTIQYQLLSSVFIMCLLVVPHMLCMNVVWYNFRMCSRKVIRQNR